MKLQFVKQENPMVWQVQVQRTDDPNDWYAGGDFVGAPEVADTLQARCEFYERIEEKMGVVERVVELIDRCGTAPTPKIVCLCGSTRFSEAFQQANFAETLAGNIVLTIGCDTKADAELFAGEEGERKKAMLDELHLRKIELADEVLILNVGGYVGDSTAREIVYAIDHGKGLRWLEKTLDEESLRRFEALNTFFGHTESET